MTNPFKQKTCPTCGSVIEDPAKDALGGFRKSDPDTSRQAAILNYPRSGSQRHKALLVIAEAGTYGATADDVSEETGIEWRSITPRLGELKNGGWITPTGRTREGRLGAQQDVLVITEKARSYLNG